MAYKWSNNLLTGNTNIDTQHKQLIEAINDLLEACSTGKGRAQILKTTDFLIKYTNTHFGDEEVLQRNSKYPDYVNHKRYHESFKKTVAEISKELNENGSSIAMVAKINSAIGMWLINHIQKEDTKVANHIKSVK